MCPSMQRRFVAHWENNRETITQSESFRHRFSINYIQSFSRLVLSAGDKQFASIHLSCWSDATKADLSDDGDGDKIPPVDEEEETYQRSTCWTRRSAVTEVLALVDGRVGRRVTHFSHIVLRVELWPHCHTGESAAGLKQQQLRLSSDGGEREGDETSGEGFRNSSSSKGGH